MAESRAADGCGDAPLPSLTVNGYFNKAVWAVVRDYDEDLLQRITDRDLVDTQNRWGWTMLMRAAEYGSVASVRFLIERGAAVNIQSDRKFTALHFTCGRDMLELEEVLLLLLRAGADPTLKDDEGRTPRDAY